MLWWVFNDFLLELFHVCILNFISPSNDGVLVINQFPFPTATPFGQLPVLEWDGVQYAQANAIARFIARKVGLYGKDEFEGLLVDSVIELINELLAGNMSTYIICPICNM